MEFIVVDTGSESNQIMMSDILSLPNCHQYSDLYNIPYKFLDSIRRIHFSYRAYCKVNIPFKNIWNRYNILNDITKNGEKEYCIIFINNSIHKVTRNYLSALKERGNVKFVLLLLDRYEDLSVNLKKNISLINFDLIYSFQISDCERYGFKFVNTVYSKYTKIDFKKNETNDLVFVGAEKGRMHDIYNVYLKAKKLGLQTDFTVIVDKEWYEYFKTHYDGITFLTSRISYLDILDKISKAKCILEICQGGQDGLTMRFYEAIFYNKMLITNNCSALNNPFFKEKFMTVYSDINKLDLAFIRKVDEVDYAYDNMFSPIYFVEKIEEDLNLDSDF